MIYPNNPLYLLSLLGYIYYLTYYTLTTKDNISLFSFWNMKKQYHISFPMVLLYIACALTISDFEIVSVVTMLIWISIPALAIYIRHDFGHVKSRRQKRPSFLSPQLFHHGLSVSHYLYSCLTSFSLD